MRKSILTIAFTMMFGMLTAFAGNNEGVSKKVENSFHKEYGEVKNASWEISKNYYKVTFTNVDHVIHVYYNEEGAKLATIRNIKTSQLPLKLQEGIRKYYQNSWVTDLFEFSSDNGSGYFITFENAEQKMVLKSVDSGSWELYSKEEKKDSEE